MPLRYSRVFLQIITCLTAAVAAGCVRHKPTPPPPPQQTVLPQTPNLKQRLDAEAIWLRQYPSLATRDGDTLIVRYNGQEIARYVNDAKGCNPYSISKVLPLYDHVNNKLLPVAEVTCHFGPLDNRYLVLPSSDKYVVKDDVSASPDGRLIAMTDSSLTPSSGQFTLMSWPSLNPGAAFKAGCRNAVWRDSTHIEALCWHNSGPTPQDPNDAHALWFQAAISRDDAGHWQMQAKSFVDPVSLKPAPANGRALPHLSADVPATKRP